MSFSRAKSAGWAFGELLTSTQMNTIDLNQSRALDGNAGGTYTPSAAVDIGNAGLKLTGTGHVIPASGQLTVQNNGDIVVNSGGQVSWQSGADLLVLAGATLALSGLMTIPTGGAILGDAGSTVSLNGTINAPLRLASTGRLRLRTSAVADTNLTITPQSFDVYYAGTTTLSSARVWQIDDTNCADGDWMLLCNQDTNNQVDVQNPSSVSLALIVGDSLSANRQWAMVIRVGGSWRALKLTQ